MHFFVILVLVTKLLYSDGASFAEKLRAISRRNEEFRIKLADDFQSTSKRRQNQFREVEEMEDVPTYMRRQGQRKEREIEDLPIYINFDDNTLLEEGNSKPESRGRRQDSPQWSFPSKEAVRRSKMKYLPDYLTRGRRQDSPQWSFPSKENVRRSKVTNLLDYLTRRSTSEPIERSNYETQENPEMRSIMEQLGGHYFYDRPNLMNSRRSTIDLLPILYFNHPLLSRRTGYFEFSPPPSQSSIVGVPSMPEHLPEAERILPGHTLLRPALGMLKSQLMFPHRELENGSGVYGNIDNLSIKYGNRNDRVVYSNFRRDGRSQPSRRSLRSHTRSSRPSRRSLADYIMLVPVRD